MFLKHNHQEGFDAVLHLGAQARWFCHLSTRLDFADRQDPQLDQFGFQRWRCLFWEGAWRFFGDYWGCWCVILPSYGSPRTHYWSSPVPCSPQGVDHFLMKDFQTQDHSLRSAPRSSAVQVQIVDLADQRWVFTPLCIFTGLLRLLRPIRGAESAHRSCCPCFWWVHWWVFACSLVLLFID